MKRMLSVAGICVVLLAMVACGGGSSGGGGTPTPTPTATPAALAVSPASASVPLGGAQQFTAAGAGLPVNWSVNGVAGGNATVGLIDSTGRYTAPATFPATSSFSVTATSQANAATNASAATQVVYPNNNKSQQVGAIKLGSSGGNALDTSATACCIGTLGSLLTRGGVNFILSNNHVLARSSVAANGEAILQAGAAACFPAEQQVAALSQQAALKPSPCTGVCTGAAPSNVDAAIAQVTSAATVDATGTILDLGAASATGIADAPPSTTLAVPATVLTNNTQVAKSGRTSSLTCSTLSSVSTNIVVAYETSCGSNVTAFNATFSNQVLVNGGNFSASGDSGSLIVTGDQARPLALLYGGNSTNTVGNPIQDVISAFTQAGPPVVVPAIVGGADHAVSCVPTQNVFPNSTTTAPASAAVLAPQERRRAMAVQQARAKGLMRDAVVNSVTVGASDDSPGEGALVIEVKAVPNTPIPAMIDGVRTKVVYTAEAAALQPRFTEVDIARTAAAKNAQADSMLGQPGIQGVGVGASLDSPGETAIVIYTIQGEQHQPIPATIGGVRTRIVEGTRFKAY